MAILDLLHLISVCRYVCLSVKKYQKLSKTWFCITFSNIRTPKVYMLVMAYDPDPTISRAFHG